MAEHDRDAHTIIEMNIQEEQSGEDVDSESRGNSEPSIWSPELPNREPTPTSQRSVEMVGGPGGMRVMMVTTIKPGDVFVPEVRVKKPRRAKTVVKIRMTRQ